MDLALEIRDLHWGTGKQESTITVRVHKTFLLLLLDRYVGEEDFSYTALVSSPWVYFDSGHIK